MKILHSTFGYQSKFLIMNKFTTSSIILNVALPKNLSYTLWTTEILLFATDICFIRIFANKDKIL